MEKVHSFFKNQKRIFVHIINNLFYLKRTYIPVFCLQKEDNEFYRIVNTNRHILVIKDKR